MTMMRMNILSILTLLLCMSMMTTTISARAAIYFNELMNDNNQMIKSLYVYDTYQQVDIFELYDGMTINVDELKTTNLTIRVECNTDDNGWMEFDIDHGMLLIVDESAPYYMGMKSIEEDEFTTVYPSALFTYPGNHNIQISYKYDDGAAGYSDTPQEHQHYVSSSGASSSAINIDTKDQADSTTTTSSSSNSDYDMIRTSTYSSKNYLTHLIDTWIFGSDSNNNNDQETKATTTDNDPFIQSLRSTSNSNIYQISFTIQYSGSSSGSFQYPDVDNQVRETITSNTPALPVRDYAVTDASPYSASTLGSWNGIKRINHIITLGLLGPEISEITSTAIRSLLINENSISTVYNDYRATLYIRHVSDKHKYSIPCYYNKNRNVANVDDTIATSGDVWLCHFTPTVSGVYNWYIDLLYGSHIAAESVHDQNNSTLNNHAKFFDGMIGTFYIEEDEEIDADSTTIAQRNGRIQVKDDDELYYETSQQPLYELMIDNTGVNMLEYNEFDDTLTNVSLSEYVGFVENDTVPSDMIVTWKGGKGKSLIGYINQHHNNGITAIIANPIHTDVMNSNNNLLSTPFINLDNDIMNYYYYDTSKLAQWNIIMEYTSSIKGIVTLLQFDMYAMDQIFNNQNSNTSLSLEYQIYIREIISRYSHNLNIIYHIVNPITESSGLLIDLIHTIDPYHNPILMDGKYI